MKNQLFALGMILRSLIKLPLGIFSLLSYFVACNITFILILLGVKKGSIDVKLTGKDFAFAFTKAITHMEEFFEISKEEQSHEFSK